MGIDTPEREIGIDPRDPLGLAADAPLLAAWLSFTAEVGAGRLTPFTIPGHKHRRDLVGDVVRGDVPLFGGLETMKQTERVLAGAERRAAAAWGVDWCRFSVGGATHANQAAVLALGRPGQEVVVSRTLHRSVLLGLVLAGLRPIWVRPAIDARTGLPGGVPVAAVTDALERSAGACAVLIGDPSYIGTRSDIAGIADAAHAAGVPLVVDAAWAAHFGFSDSVPPHALHLGADALVTSAHKMLPAWSQGALLLARTTASGGLLDADRLDRGFDAGNTTSAGGAILASIDASRALLEREGPRLIRRLAGLVTAARERLSACAGIEVLGSDAALEVDPTKLVVLLPGAGVNGHEVEADLLGAGIPLEMADHDVLIPVITIADDRTTVDRLVDALLASIERRRGVPRAPNPSAAWAVETVGAVAPRDAFFSPHETVAAADAVGRVSAELVAPYPPGVPVLAPGETVTADALAALRSTLAGGGRVAYAADPSLRTLQVLAREG